MSAKLYVAGEDIEPGDSVVVSLIDGRVYRAGPVPGTYVADAVERIRKGFRVAIDDDCAREDDA